MMLPNWYLDDRQQKASQRQLHTDGNTGQREIEDPQKRRIFERAETGRYPLQDTPN